MPHDNNATRIRRELLVRLAKEIFDGQLVERADRIPLEMLPKMGRQPLRCCIHQERAILRYRAMAMLGFSVQDETDEIKPLSAYAQEALVRPSRDPRLLTVIEDACSACVRGKYFVSNACRGCMAQTCVFNCPKQAIRFENGHSVIDPEACVNCGRCQEVCAFNAIVRVAIPCEEACPVEAITRKEAGKQEINHERCIACGRCMQACPFGAIVEQSEMVEVLGALASGREMVALLAPSLGGQFAAPLEQVVGALRALGFKGVVEVAAGADLTAEQEARELGERLEAGDSFMTSSCCPAFKGLLNKRFPNLVPHISATPTPLHFAAGLAEASFPGLPRVFLSPCVAKRMEVLESKCVEHVLTFEELGAAFVAKGIDVDRCAAEDADVKASDGGRGFAASGGVRNAVLAGLKEEVPTELLAGLGKESLRQLRLYAAGKGSARFLECMACESGCISGPCTLTPSKLARRRIPTAAAKAGIP